MKKLLRASLLLLAILLLPLSVGSCRKKTETELMGMIEGDRAFALYGLLREKAASADGYILETEMTYEATLGGEVPYRASVTSWQICTDPQGEAFYEYTRQTLQTQWGHGSPESHHRTITSGYSGGYVFESADGGAESAAYRSLATPEEYRALYGTPADRVLVNLSRGNCSGAACSRTENGGWEASFTGLDQATLDHLAYRYGLDLASTGCKAYLLAATVTVTATPDLIPDTVLLDLEYGEPTADGRELAPLPGVRYTLRFRDWNGAAPEAVDLSGYTDGGSLLIRDGFLEALYARKTAMKGDYETTLRQTVIADGVTTGRTHTTRLTFVTEAGWFSLEGHTEGTDWDGQPFRSGYTYRGGFLAETAHDPATGKELSRQKTPMTDWEGRAIPGAEVDIAQTVPAHILRVEILDEEEGRYRLHLGGGLRETFAKTYADGGGEMTVFESYLDITLWGDVLNSYTYVLHTGGRTGSAKEQDNRLEMTCDFTAPNGNS